MKLEFDIDTFIPFVINMVDGPLWFVMLLNDMFDKLAVIPGVISLIKWVFLFFNPETLISMCYI